MHLIENYRIWVKKSKHNFALEEALEKRFEANYDSEFDIVILILDDGKG